MLDQKLIRENPTAVEESLALRGKVYKISHVQELALKKKRNRYKNSDPSIRK